METVIFTKVVVESSPRVGSTRFDVKAVEGVYNTNIQPITFKFVFRYNIKFLPRMISSCLSRVTIKQVQVHSSRLWCDGGLHHGNWQGPRTRVVHHHHNILTGIPKESWYWTVVTCLQLSSQLLPKGFENKWIKAVSIRLSLILSTTVVRIAN